MRSRRMPPRVLGWAWFTVMLLLTGPITAQAQNPITIGFGMALTGGLAPNGKAALFAMQLWEEGDQRQGRASGPPGEAGLLR